MNPNNKADSLSANSQNTLSDTCQKTILLKESILKVEKLVVSFNTDFGKVRAVDGAAFELKKGETLGIVGESGCGKSVTSLAIMGLLPKPSGVIESGNIDFILPTDTNCTLKKSKNSDSSVREYKTRDLARLSSQDMQKIRGKKISMIFQEPMTALNPVQKIGKQINEVYELHFNEMSKSDRNKGAVEMLLQVGIGNPEKLMTVYPHQLSGGMRQRVMIAIALISKPDILIADEPTTALDVTVQAQILELIKKLQQEMSMSMILITHDLGVIAENCDNVVVMYGGMVVEKANVVELFKNPFHPYTRGLLESIPSLAREPKTILPTIKGRVPSLEDMPKGCRFCTRCPDVKDICKTVKPMEIKVAVGHYTACHLYKCLL